jgi:hypothetical protein
MSPKKKAEPTEDLRDPDQDAALEQAFIDGTGQKPPPVVNNALPPIPPPPPFHNRDHWECLTGRPNV